MRGPLSYLGGKTRLAARIISRIPDHLTYVEPFAGGAQIFFRKPPSKVEVLNDLDHEVITFYRVCQLHHSELIRYMRHTIASREWFSLHQKTDPLSLTDVQRAARFLYLLKNAFASRIVRQNYKYAVIARPNFNPDEIPAMIEKTHQRLARVQLECLPYEQILSKFDRPTTFFYCDPPYFEKPLYKYNFSEADYELLAERLASLKGKFLLSLNDTPQVRRIFSSFHAAQVSLAYSSHRKTGLRFSELLISNY